MLRKLIDNDDIVISELRVVVKLKEGQSWHDENDLPGFTLKINDGDAIEAASPTPQMSGELGLYEQVFDLPTNKPSPIGDWELETDLTTAGWVGSQAEPKPEVEDIYLLMTYKKQ